MDESTLPLDTCQNETHNYFFFPLKAHEIVKLPIIKDPSKYLKCKIYFTFRPRCYNVNKNMEKWKFSGVIIATTV